VSSLAALSCAYPALPESLPIPGGLWLCASWTQDPVSWWTQYPVFFRQPPADLENNSSLVWGSPVGLPIADVVLYVLGLVDHVCLQEQLSVLLAATLRSQGSQEEPRGPSDEVQALQLPLSFGGDPLEILRAHCES